MKDARLETSVQLFESAAKLAMEVITPIICHNGVRESQHGMGTFLQVGESKFLVTAAHVINQAGGAGYDLSIFDEILPGIPKKAVPLEGQPHQLQESLDVAIIELSKETCSALSRRRFLPLAYFLMKPVQPGCFCIFGYPTSGTTDLPDGQSKYLDCFAYGTGLFSGDTSNLESYREREHIALVRDGTQVLNRDGNPSSIPDRLGGISGCPVWQVHSKGQDLKSWTPQRIHVVGVQTAVYTEVIRATRCWAIAYILWEQYPNLRDVLTLNNCTPGHLNQWVTEESQGQRRCP